jgi:hypothetical protein
VHGGRCYLTAVHLRPPSIDPGTSAGLWAIALALLIFFGSISLGVDRAPAFIVSALVGFGIFLYVRLYGRDAEI